MLDSELGIVIKDIYGIITVLSESLSLQVSITSSESILNKMMDPCWSQAIAKVKVF